MSGGSQVLVDQTIQDRYSVELVGVEVRRSVMDNVRILGGDTLGDALMRLDGVVMLLVLGWDGAQMRLAEDRHAVQGSGKVI